MSTSFRYMRSVLFTLAMLGLFFCGVANTQAEVKILSNSRHAFGNISSTIDLLLGGGHIGNNNDIVLHSTTMEQVYSGCCEPPFDTEAIYYDQTGATTSSQTPYNIYTSSFAVTAGDTVSLYNEHVGDDYTHNLGFTNSTNTTPPIFYTAPGGSSGSSKPGVEWTIDPTIFCVSTLSCLTASNAGIMSSLRHNHPSWNWLDVKAALRQTGTNWDTGYDSTDYGFGVVNYASSTDLADNEILLQPPVASSAMNDVGQLTFTLFPFKQSRRVKEVLFQFASDPGFQADELTLSDITTLGGTKITERSEVTATSTSSPIFTSLTDAYFVWFTADDANDNTANFSRIDTYNVLGPINQDEIHFSSSFDLSSPADDEITSVSPTFEWEEATSYLGVDKYQLYIDGVLDTDNITATSATSSSPLSDGAHTWYVKAVNASGTATSSVSTRTIQVTSDYASSQTWYVDNVNGDDSNPGTQAQPWFSIDKANNTALPGNTVIIIKNEGVPYREKIQPTDGTTLEGNIVFRGVSALSKPEIWGSENVSEAITGSWSVYGGGNANTYQQALPTTKVVAAGSATSTLSKRTKGTDEDSLNEGEWFYANGNLYYRLGAGEDINTLHIEAGQIDFSLACISKNTFQDLIIKYANTSGFQIGGGCIGERLEVYDTGDSSGNLVSGTSEAEPGPTLRYSVLAGNSTYGLSMAVTQYANVYNNLAYGNDNGFYLWVFAHNSTIRNNIFANNTNNIDFNTFAPINDFTASNNNWDADTVDTDWTDTYQGTDNLASTSPLFVDSSNLNFKLQQFSPNIDAGFDVSLTSDIIGQPIYGAPDIGAFEYQPPYQAASDGIPQTGSVRLYADGKYRMLTATSSTTTVPLQIAPSGGWNASDRNHFMDLAIDSWSTSSMSWTASSSYATNVTFTLSGLDQTREHSVFVDGVPGANLTGSCSDGTCVPESNGTLTFIYEGAWSEHEFVVTEGDIYTSGGGGGGGGGSRSSDDDDASTDEVLADSVKSPIEEADLREALLLRIAELNQLIQDLTLQLNAKNGLQTPHQFNQSLSPGDSNPDVLNLQKKLNHIGFLIAQTGIGSPGNETNYYGPLTVKAVMKFQCSYTIICYGTPDSTGYGNFGPQTRAALNSLRY